ncbi:MAG: hypothetical protein QOJ51_3894 [Acidobacteriaceae bacterium]|nr:hypothetical protein [Acidobacteriaceae bacterium]
MVPWLDAGLRIVEVYSPLTCFGDEGSHFLKAVVFSNYEAPKTANDAQ